MSQIFWKIPETQWVRCPRCKARRGQPCRGKSGGQCPVAHTVRRERLTRVLNRMWCRGCRRRGTSAVETVAAFPCDKAHLHFYCKRCMAFAREYDYVRPLSPYEPEFECVTSDHKEFQTQILADMAMRSLSQGW